MRVVHLHECEMRSQRAVIVHLDSSSSASNYPSQHPARSAVYFQPESHKARYKHPTMPDPVSHQTHSPCKTLLMKRNKQATTTIEHALTETNPNQWQTSHQTQKPINLSARHIPHPVPYSLAVCYVYVVSLHLHLVSKTRPRNTFLSTR